MRAPFAAPFAALLLASAPAAVRAQDAPESGAVTFGDDTGLYANDGECDDIRFTGPGLSGDGMASHAGHDATDCRARFGAGEVTLRSADELLELGFFTGIYDGVDFGDNEGQYARDGECDDPRFTGRETSGGHFPDHEYHDATDCRSAYAAGRAWLTGHGVDPQRARYDGVDFGDNRGEFPDDGMCDDPRFEGEGLSDAALLDSDIGHDAKDCLRAWLDGTLMLKTEDAG